MEYGKIDWNDVWKELMTTQQRLDKTGDKNTHWNKRKTQNVSGRDHRQTLKEQIQHSAKFR